jgi:hypothetical protein
LTAKVKDKKTAFIEPNSKAEQDDWLEKLIAEISGLTKGEFADLLPNEIEYMLGLLIPVLE